MKYAGYFTSGGEANEGKTPEEVEQEVYAVLEQIKNEELPLEELQKVKNNFAAGEYRRLGANFSILYQLIRYDGLGDWRELNEGGAKIQAVTAADVQRVAKKYFIRENRSVGIYSRKAGAAGSGQTTSTSIQPSQ
jgi:predicted Zn-dependent peptidase